MTWSVRVARVARINVRIHVTFLLIVAFGAMQWGWTHGGSGAAFGVVLTLLLFAGVALHELGHGLVAKRFGLPVREILLLPFGGVAMMDGTPRRAWHELVIALAGPAVNVLLAALLAIPAGFALLALPDRDGAGVDCMLTPSVASLAVWLFVANIILATFNMIPALPMDGGRVLRAILAGVLGQSKATRIASIVGQVLAGGMGVWAAANGQFIVLFIAVVVFFAAWRERRNVELCCALAGVDAGAISRCGLSHSALQTIVQSMAREGSRQARARCQSPAKVTPRPWLMACLPRATDPARCAKKERFGHAR